MSDKIKPLPTSAPVPRPLEEVVGAKKAAEIKAKKEADLAKALDRLQKGQEQAQRTGKPVVVAQQVPRRQQSGWAR